MTDKPEANSTLEHANEKRVLVAIDFSEDSRAALLWACQFADCVSGRLLLLHVIHDPASRPGFYRLENQTRLEPIEDVAELMMEKFLSEMTEHYPDIDVLKTADTQHVIGLPPGRIVEMAELLNAELIVIGSRGMTGLPHLMLGSVAERVVELANRPVVVVKAADHGNKKAKEKKDKMEKKQEKKRMKEQQRNEGDTNG